MCKILVRKWDNLKSSLVAEAITGDFPKCGVKYTGKYGQGLVIARFNAPISLIKEKARAANQEITHVFVMPRSIDRLVNIPTLTDVA